MKYKIIITFISLPNRKKKKKQKKKKCNITLIENRKVYI